MSKNGGLVYIKLFTDDLIAHMSHTDEEPEISGARLRLWCYARREDPVGTLPNDVPKLRKWAKLDTKGTLKRWQRAWNEIKSGWLLDDTSNRWIIKRIVRQQEDRQSFIDHQTKASNARWAKNKASRDDPGISKPGSLGDMPPTPSPTLKRRSREEPLLTPKEVKKEEKSANVDNSPRKPITDWLKPEEKEQLEALIPSVMDANRSTFPKIQNLLRRWMQIRPPWPVCETILEKIRQYKPEDPGGYAYKIMAIEEGNYHAARAVARHSTIKEAEKKPAPIVSIDRGMEHIGAIPILKSLTRRAEEAPNEHAG